MILKHIKSYIFLLTVFIMNPALMSSDNVLKKNIQETFKNKEEIFKGLTESSENISLNDKEKVTLIDVVFETLSTSNLIQSAKEKRHQVKIELDMAYSYFYPKVDLALNNTKEYRKNEKIGTEQNVQLKLSQNLYAGGADIARIESLKQNYETADMEYKITLNKEIIKAVNAYFTVLYKNKEVNVNKKHMKRLNEILKIISLKYSSGDASLGDLTNMKANISNAKSKIIEVESEMNKAFSYYKYVVGQRFQNTVPSEDTEIYSIKDYDDILELALHDNYTLNSYRSNILAQKNQREINQAKFKPSLDFLIVPKRHLQSDTYLENSNSLMAQVTLSYNLYNGNKDELTHLSINSKLKEFQYGLEEETEKLKWNLSNLYTSIKSSNKASQSVKEEVISANNTVFSYWEAFRMGEQNLESLLLIQRQFNAAELILIQHKQNAVLNYFNILKLSAQLLDYFGIDEFKEQFIRKERINHNVGSDYVDEETLKTDLLIKEIKDSSPEVKNSVEDLLQFKNKLLSADEEYWTIRIGNFYSNIHALSFFKKNDIAKEAFIFEFLDENILKVDISYGIYSNQEEAMKNLEALIKKNAQGEREDLKIEMVKIKQIKKLYKESEGKPLVFIDKPLKKSKPFETDKIFKEAFLSAPSDYYTINVGSFSSNKTASEFIKEYKMIKNSFVFMYGENKEWVKVMYGVYKSYEDAENGLQELNDIKKDFYPLIEKIASKQLLYKQYNTLKSDKKK